jgi:tyrosine-protein kinase shark
VLLDCGASIRSRTKQNQTPLDLAEQNNAKQSACFLRQYRVGPARSIRHDWLHEQFDFNRHTAKYTIETVNNGPCNGMFIVWTNSTMDNNCILSVYYNGNIVHFDIVYCNDRGYFIGCDPYFDTIEHLIDHYCQTSDSLPTILTCSVNCHGHVRSSRVQTRCVRQSSSEHGKQSNTSDRILLKS